MDYKVSAQLLEDVLEGMGANKGLAVEEIIKKIASFLIVDAKVAIDSAKGGDANLNRIFYGRATQCADILSLFGHKAALHSRKRGNLVEIEGLAINGHDIDLAPKGQG